MLREARNLPATVWLTPYDFIRSQAPFLTTHNHHLNCVYPFIILLPQAARDPYGYLLSALHLQKLYIERSVAPDKLASVSAVVEKRNVEWKRLVTPDVVQELKNVVNSACSGLGVTVKW
jgi:hypothetical protein